jgi:hypothetical protein
LEWFYRPSLAPATAWPIGVGSRQLASSKHSPLDLNSSTTTNTTLKMLVSLTVGKVDAGVAVLLTEDKRLVSISHPHATNPGFEPPFQSSALQHRNTVAILNHYALLTD